MNASTVIEIPEVSNRAGKRRRIDSGLKLGAKIRGARVIERNAGQAQDGDGRKTEDDGHVAALIAPELRH